MSAESDAQEIRRLKDAVEWLAANAVGSLRMPLIRQIWGDHPAVLAQVEQVYTVRRVRAFLEGGHEGYEAWRSQMLQKKAQLLKIDRIDDPAVLLDGCEHCGRGRHQGSCSGCGAPA